MRNKKNSLLSSSPARSMFLDILEPGWDLRDKRHKHKVPQKTDDPMKSTHAIPYTFFSSFSEWPPKTPASSASGKSLLCDYLKCRFFQISDSQLGPWYSFSDGSKNVILSLFGIYIVRMGSKTSKPSYVSIETIVLLL